jgi:mannose-6-phosphate isomerase
LFFKNNENKLSNAEKLMNQLYPLKFKPIFKEKIWGGQKIKTELGLDSRPLPNCGEAWVLSGVPGSETKVINGFLEGNSLNDLLEVYMDDLIGEDLFYKYDKEFPILVKFIDSNDYLSIQVHPDDALAAKRKTGNGKSEMWYVLEAEPGSELITGFNREVSQDIYLEHLNNKNLKEILNVEKVKKGDVFYIPSGRVHALGPGILLAEIQQTSDTTYRIYDWDRTDEKGRSREIHTELALDAIDFSLVTNYRTEYRKIRNQTEILTDTPFFTINILDFDQLVNKEYALIDSFVIYICVDGSAILHYDDQQESLKKGETILIPAVMDRLALEPKKSCKVLEVFIQ